MNAVEILCYSCTVSSFSSFFSSLLVLSAKLIIKSMLLLSNVHDVVDGVIVGT